MDYMCIMPNAEMPNAEIQMLKCQMPNAKRPMPNADANVNANGDQTNPCTVKSLKQTLP